MATENDAEGRSRAADGLRPGRVRIPLRNLDEVQRELARLYRDMRGGVIESQDGSRMANVLQILARVIEGGQIEARLTALEEADKRRFLQ
ncbi:MAG: hypothetical protein ROZ37_04230 [Aromatoleum sp.]|jgi:hypothetical protein|uniref:hypothetical protein n=1 Tax=Aromatoleum sp. TaxID=2307007 RepID=UPI0028961C2D|nr:hypothetical protein [Aromatoleum sp.]MDT3669527.1 hypothetical protein [Aromatoleum sp.]